MINRRVLATKRFFEARLVIKKEHANLETLERLLDVRKMTSNFSEWSSWIFALSGLTSEGRGPSLDTSR